MPDTHDSMWIKTILKKLPRNIFEDLLKENWEEEACAVGETLDNLGVVITQNAYVMEQDIVLPLISCHP